METYQAGLSLGNGTTTAEESLSAATHLQRVAEMTNSELETLLDDPACAKIFHGQFSKPFYKSRRNLDRF